VSYSHFAASSDTTKKSARSPDMFQDLNNPPCILLCVPWAIKSHCDKRESIQYMLLRWFNIGLSPLSLSLSQEVENNWRHCTSPPQFIVLWFVVDCCIMHRLVDLTNWLLCFLPFGYVLFWNMKDSIIVGGLEEGLLNVLSGCRRSVATQDPVKRILKRDIFWREGVRETR
jgi:hypothetical protein